MARPPHAGAGVIDALAARPGAAQLMRLAAQRPDLALVGGAVRDLLLDRPPRELDVVVAHDAAAIAAQLAAAVQSELQLTARVSAHERFGTASVEWPGARVDIAARRAETYPEPGALPSMRPGSVEEDLMRRDFTVNAIAVTLGGPRAGELSSVEHALEDLRERRLRVLHDQSFHDDPTRLLRLARYSARLGFTVEAHTHRLAARALAAGALDTVSPARLGAELRLALSEADAPASLDALDQLGVLGALDPPLRFDAALARSAVALLPEDGRSDLLLGASLLLEIARTHEHAQQRMHELLDGLEFTAADRQRIIDAAHAAPTLPARLSRAARPSQVNDVLSRHSIEAAALAAAIGGESRAIGEWLARLRHVRLEIGGEDLLAAGLSAGPEIGRRLQLVLARKLDGEVAGRESELQAASKPAR